MLFKLLHFSSEAEEENKNYKWYGDAIYWKDYSNAYEMLQMIKPAKVIFLFIDTYYQAAVNVACKELSIPTYHLEHGLLADYAIAFDNTLCPPRAIPFIKRAKNELFKFKELYARIKCRMFLNNTIKCSSHENAVFLKQFIETRRKYNSLDTFRNFKSPKRFAGKYISFSPNIFKIHQEHDALPADQKVHFIGIPYFDHFANLQPVKITRVILVIDQPLAEQGLLKWDVKAKNEFVEKLTQICKKLDFKLYVKPHPKQNLSLWIEAEQKGLCKIINDVELEKIAPTVPVVLGFYSTLLMPFAAFQHTTLVTYENHPAGDFLVSRPFVEAGVAQPIYELEELHGILQDVEALHQKQLPHKAKFTEEWMYKFDGKAGDRLRDILLSDDL